MTLNALQRETILEWVDERSNAFTIEELAIHFDVHYQTSWRWIKDLEGNGLVEKHPLRRNGKDQYVRSTDTNKATASQRALKVQRGNETKDLLAWALEVMPSENIQYVGAGLCYLIVRSYYADEPDYQHLRGSIPAVDVRSVIAQRLVELEKDIEVVRQVLSYRLPFAEGSELVRRCGTLPVGRSMTDVMTLAQEFSRNLSPNQAAVAQVIASQSPAVPEEESPRTLGEALGKMNEGEMNEGAPQGALHVVRDAGEAYDPIPFADG